MAQSDNRFVRLVAVSGPVCAGKTTLCEALADDLVVRVSTRELILRLSREVPAPDRQELQRMGEALDVSCGGRWVAAAAREHLELHPRIAVDSVRTVEQVSALRDVAPTLHIHLTALNEVLAARFERRVRSDPEFESSTWVDTRRNATERSVERLADIADIVLDTGDMSLDACVNRTRACLG